MKPRRKTLFLASGALLLFGALGGIWFREAGRQPKLRLGMDSQQVIEVLRAEIADAHRRAERGLPPFKEIQLTPDGEVTRLYYFRKGHVFLIRCSTLDFTNGMLKNISSQWQWEWKF